MIELELRGECTQTYEELKARLDARAVAAGVEPTAERRTSVMCFGAMGERKIDMRCRVTNGEAEVVAKIGAFHAHDRTEVTQAVSVDQLIGFSKLFAAMGFDRVKVGTRFQENYVFGDVSIVLSRGQSGLAYVEFEKLIDDQTHMEEGKRELEEMAAALGVKLWTTGDEFYTFCQRLTDEEDWAFTGNNEDCGRLYNQIIDTGSNSPYAAPSL